MRQARCFVCHHLGFGDESSSTKRGGRPNDKHEPIDLAQVNTLRPEQNGRYIADDFSCAFPLTKCFKFWIQFHENIRLINKISTLIGVAGWCPKPSSDNRQCWLRSLKLSDYMASLGHNKFIQKGVTHVTRVIWAREVLNSLRPSDAYMRQ